MFRDQAAGVNARPPYRRFLSQTYSRRPSRPALTRPSPPRSGKHRRRMLKASLRSLAQMARVSVAYLVTLGPAELLAVAGCVDRRTGDARRLAAKVIRLAPPTKPRL